MKYIVVQLRPKEAEKKLNEYAAAGWRVVSSSESTWTIKKCFGFSNTVDSLLNIILCKEA